MMLGWSYIHKRTDLVNMLGTIFCSVWTYDFLEDINLVKEHALLIVVHMALSENLDGALGTGLSVNAHSHFTEGA